MMYTKQRYPQRACCYEIRPGVECGTMFWPADPKQVVCVAHSIAHQAQRRRERYQRRKLAS